MGAFLTPLLLKTFPRLIGPSFSQTTPIKLMESPSNEHFTERLPTPSNSLVYITLHHTISTSLLLSPPGKDISRHSSEKFPQGFHETPHLRSPAPGDLQTNPARFPPEKTFAPKANIHTGTQENPLRPGCPAVSRHVHSFPGWCHRREIHQLR